MTIRTGAILILFTACFASFSWAMQGGFFRSVEATTRGLRIIRVLAALFVLVHIVALVSYRRSTVWTGVLGAVLYAASLALFWSAIAANRKRPLSLAFSSDAPEHLVRSGPYRFIRHPFYTSYTLGWIAGVVASEQPWLAVTVVVMLVVYYKAAAMEERKFLAGPLADDYVNYRSCTGMFSPRLRLR